MMHDLQNRLKKWLERHWNYQQSIAGKIAYEKVDDNNRGVSMVKSIVKDIFFLNQKSEPATKADNQVVQDLLDTLKANETGCVGMAANMREQ
jgi:hypothetical protein